MGPANHSAVVVWAAVRRVAHELVRLHSPLDSPPAAPAAHDARGAPRLKRPHPCFIDLFYRMYGVQMLLYGDEPRAEPVYFMANHQHYHDNLTVISAMAARVAGVSGAGIRWLAKRALMVQPLGWSMYCSGEVCPRPLYNEHHHALPHLLYHRRALLLALLVFVP